MDNAIKLYMKEHGGTVAGRKIEIIRRDTGGVAPDVAKRHAQELVVRDKVDILAGFVLTPNALAAADVSAEAKKFMVVMNAATAIVTTKSPDMARTSLTVPQLDLGIDSKKTRVMGQGEITEENALKVMGDAALGFITAFHYDHNHKSAANAKFVGAYHAAWGRTPDFFGVGAWDGIHLIYEV